MLPAVAVLHPMHAAVRSSGAVLATALGTAAVVVGLAASVNVDLQPAALFVLGMWWWTIGKMWVQTGVLGTRTGAWTAGLGIAAMAASVVAAFAVAVALVRPDLPYLDVWRGAEVVLGAWLLALAARLRAVAGHSMGR